MSRAEEVRADPYERRLVARLQSGEAAALDPLFELHFDRLYAFAFHLSGNREDAEEIVSDAFLRALERASSFRGDCPFRGWLFGIARNLCYDRLRQPRLLTLEPEESERRSDGGSAAAGMETAALVRRALSELAEEHRLVLTLCDVEEWDAREVAAMLERSVAATKSLLYRARRALRDRLKELWDEEDGDAL